jgi:alcohol dehydrogenase class IV
MSLGHVVKLKAQTDKAAAEQIARLAPFLGITSSGDATKDALTIGDRVLDLVKELGFSETLTDRNIGKDQVDIITQRATQQKDGKIFDAVKQLVEKLY